MTATIVTHRSRTHGGVVRVPVRPLPGAVYRRRRITAALVAVGLLTFTGAVATSLAGPGGVPASATGDQPAFERATVVARHGDTLWSIAHAHRGEVAHGRYVDALVALNGGASISAGQVVRLP
jgi:nucleoid-associated protein YgaU